jgi:hypothetical protein
MERKPDTTLTLYHIVTKHSREQTILNKGKHDKKTLAEEASNTSGYSQLTSINIDLMI